MTDDKKKHTKKAPDPIVEKEELIETGSTDDSEVEVIEPESVEMVSLPADELAGLKEELEHIQKQSKEYFEGWQRERADFMNYKKRIEREQQQIHQVVSANIIKKFIVILDDMELAVKNRPEKASDKNWWEGMELISRKLQGILEVEGVTRIPAEKEIFNPNRHEAISHEDNSDFESGQVIEVLKQGYVMGDRIIRPALVRVAR
jgi:molecular chaperone GrpE